LIISLQPFAGSADFIHKRHVKVLTSLMMYPSEGQHAKVGVGAPRETRCWQWKGYYYVWNRDIL